MSETAATPPNDPFRSLFKQIWWIVLIRASSPYCSASSPSSGLASPCGPSSSSSASTRSSTASCSVTTRSATAGPGRLGLVARDGRHLGPRRHRGSGVARRDRARAALHHRVLCDLLRNRRCRRRIAVPEGPRVRWVWSLVAGILAILFGIVLLIFPGGGITGLIWLLVSTRSCSASCSSPSHSRPGRSRKRPASSDAPPRTPPRSG